MYYCPTDVQIRHVYKLHIKYNHVHSSLWLLTNAGVVQLSTHNLSIIQVPSIVSNSAPDTLIAHFNTTLHWSGSTDQPNTTMITAT